MVARSNTLTALAAGPSTDMAPPPLPTRTYSSSTTSTNASVGHSVGMYGTRSSSFTTVPPASSNASPRLAPAAHITLRKTSGGSDGSGSSKSSEVDELDKMGYVYSLRIAALHHRLAAPPPTTPISPSSMASFEQLSPTGARMTYSSFRTPELPHDEPPVPLPMRRKKSALSLKLGKKDELKLPREFMAEFWDVLAHEQGDRGWTAAVRSLLGLVEKRGYKTTAGHNMREIPVLVDTFSACVPASGPQSGPIIVQQAHLLRLLYNALPSSKYFSSSDSVKDKDLLFRLRAEVQMRMAVPPSSPDPGAGFSPSLMAHGVAAKATNGLGLAPPSPTTPLTPNMPLTPNTPTTPQSGFHADSVRRKPSPVWTGKESMLGNLIEAVGDIWAVPRDVLEKDSEDVQRQNLEKLYLDDLKRKLSALSRLPPSPEVRARHSELSGALGDLLASFPELTIPTSPVAFGEAVESSFFTPPKKMAVFFRLTRRAKGDSTRRVSELLSQCQKTWEVPSRQDKEREVEDLVHNWDQSVGSQSEMEWSQRLSEAVAELAGAVAPGETLPSPLELLHARLMSHLTCSLQDIFPTDGQPPKQPPPSLIPLFNSAPHLLIQSPSAAKALDYAADELRGAAVAEYVSVAGDVGAQPVGVRIGESGKDVVVEGFERAAEWIDREVRDVEKSWGKGMESLNPAGIILSKQLPLLLAELQVLELAVGTSSDIFALYDVTARLMGLWDRLCPTIEHGFDLDGFFEPHVITWLRETEANETHQWVTRTIGMDSWMPEGSQKHSQSVIDLFEFIRSAIQVVRDLPLSEYKRALFLVDLARTSAAALSQYASSLHGLFLAEMTAKAAQPKELKDRPLVGGKASAWLAKGKHAVHKIDQRIDQRLDRKRDAFLVPSAACVKLTNLRAAQQYLDNLSSLLEAEETATSLRKHKLSAAERPARQVFSVTVLRGQHLLTKGSTKAADAFVTVTDKMSGERLFKSRTVLESEDPKWQQTFELTLGSSKPLELTVFDRQLVGKHDPIGTRKFNLDPKSFEDTPQRDLVLPLSPRGVVHLRIATEGGEKHDVTYHLNAVSRLLDRTADDMTREIVDVVGEYIRHELKPAMDRALKPLKGSRGKVALNDADIEASLAPIFDYMDESLATFTSTMTPELRQTVTLGIWERLIDDLIALLVPPLGDTPTHKAAQPQQNVDVIFRWLQSLKRFLNATEGGEELGVPSTLLQQGGYRDMLLLGQCLDLPTPALKERAGAAVRAATAGGGSALRNINLNTSRQRVDEDNFRVAEMMLRILRMRGADDFLRDMVGMLGRARIERSAGVV